MKSKKIIPFLPAFFWLVIIVVLSGYPGNQLPKTAVWQADKLIHVLMYGALSVLLLLPFATQKKRLKVRIAIILTAVFYGGLMEVLQEYLFINRSGSWLDFLANTIGTVLGVFLAPLVFKMLPINRWSKKK